MRTQVPFLLLISPLLVAADIVKKDSLGLSFDKALEGRVGIQKVVDEIVDKVSGETKRIERLERPGVGVAGVLDERDLFSPAGGLLDKRQAYCEEGYWYCSDFGRCCPRDTNCCPYGYCLETDTTCCPNGPCRGGEECCGPNNCMEEGAQCCRDGSHCPRGNSCYIVEGYDDMRCCTNSQCTAYVDETGWTSTATTSTSTRTYTTTATQYYYWTVTWWYYYYYWTYSADIYASIVTSSRSTTSSTLSVRTTDAGAAEDYFSSLSEELELPTPASATSLEDIAGETSFVSEATTITQTAMETDTETVEVTLPSASPTAAEDQQDEEEIGGGGDIPQDDGDPSNPPEGGAGEGGDGASAAMGLLAQINYSFMAFLTFGVGVGVAAAML